ncbi:MAG TPA: DCC1-like thiol-disulfide oxidoreductase family protein [Cyclobacteriaceae bacterium]|nr:DCC1-like thiol-disulfide oxidoreductase family protein [Cyclobacteriaceae bacterium]
MGADPSIGSINSQADIVLFDGVCNLCQGAVQFIIKRDPKARFKFASLQSGFGQAIISRNELSTSTSGQTIILIRNDKCFERSRAVLEIARYLSGGWPLLYVFIVIPRFLRDPVYNLIARNRYRLFGKQESCMLPDPDIISRFIE